MNPVVTFGGPRYVSSRVGNLLEWVTIGSPIKESAAFSASSVVDARHRYASLDGSNFVVGSTYLCSNGVCSFGWSGSLPITKLLPHKDALLSVTGRECSRVEGPNQCIEEKVFADTCTLKHGNNFSTSFSFDNNNSAVLYHAERCRNIVTTLKLMCM